MFNFLSKNKERHSIIVDIQSGLIRGALITISEDNRRTIEQITTETIPRKNHTDTHYMIKVMQKSLSAVLRTLSLKHHITDANIVLSSPWILSHSKALKIKFDNPIRINDYIVGNLIQDEKKKMEIAFKERHKGLESVEHTLEYIEQKIYDIKLNGYSITDYNGKTAQEIEILLAATLSARTILNKTDSIIYRYTHIRRPKYHSALLLNFDALRKTMPDINDYVYMHIHSELTDVIIVRNGNCSHIASFPFGTAGLIRKISHSLRQNEEISDSDLNNFENNKLDGEHNAKISRIVSEYSKQWLGMYRSILNIPLESSLMPRTYCLSSHSHINIFQNILNDEISKSYEINIINFSLEKIHSDIMYRPNVAQSQLIEMYALALGNML